MAYIGNQPSPTLVTTSDLGGDITTLAKDLLQDATQADMKATLGMSGVLNAGVFYENGQTVTADYTITTNKNAMSAGPISINSGIVVTVPSGSTWTIV